MERPFKIRDIGEIAIRCSDMDAMLDFYHRILGLEVLSPPDNGIAFLKIGDGHAGHTKVLALFLPGIGHAVSHDLVTPATGPASSLHHLALNVDYATQDAAVEWFREQGLTPNVQHFGWIGWRGVFVYDPEGNTVELVAYDPNWKKSD